MPRQLLGVAILLVTAVATIATSRGVPTASSEEAFALTLDPDHPFDIRRVAIVVRHAGNQPSSVELSVGPRDLVEGESGYRLSLIPDDPSETPRPGFTGEGAGVRTSLRLDDSCATDCDRSYTLISRLSDPAGAAIAQDLTARIDAEYDSGVQTPLAAATEISVGVDDSSSRGLVTVRDVLSGQAVVGSEQLHDTWAGQLRVAGAALVAAGDARPIGTIWVTVIATPSAQDARADVTVKVIDPAESARSNDQLSTDVPRLDVRTDWLSACRPGEDCAVPIALEFEWEPVPDDAGRIPLDGRVTLDWTIEATLEYVGATAAPPGATVDLIADQ